VKITGIIWLDEIVDKIERKHAVKASEVAAVFVHMPRFRFVEKGHRPDENVYAALGQTTAGRFLTVYFVYKLDGRALIISARDMTQAERKVHERR
jgi:uncharacterized DUF497 family protein